MSDTPTHPSSVERSVWITRPDVLRMAVGALELRAAGHTAAAAAIGRMIRRWQAAVVTERFATVDELDLEIARTLEQHYGGALDLDNVVSLSDRRGTGQ